MPRTVNPDEPTPESEETPAPETEETLPVEDVVDTEESEEWDSYKMDPNDEVWPGGPNFGMINAWKDEFGDVYVTSVTPDHHVVWRTINRFEYRRMVKNLEQSLASGMAQSEANMNNEEAIAELCVLYPPYNRLSPASEMAGVASTISNQVMEASAFSAVEVRQL